MNIIRRGLLQAATWALKSADISLSNPMLARVLGVGPTWAKVNVTETTQLQITTAWSAVRLIAEAVGTLPLHLYRTTTKGRERAKDDPRYELVRWQPCDYLTAPEWKESMVVSLATMGQAYNPVTRFESTGRVISIQPVHKSRVTPEVRQDGSIVYHLTDRNGRPRTLTRRDVLPVRGFGGVGDLEGFAPHRMHSNSLALSVAMEKYAAEFFGSGGRPQGILKTKAEFGEQDRDQIRLGFAKYLQESREKGELPVLDGETDYLAISTPNNEAQFIESRKLQIAEVARIYRVPLHMLMETEKASYNNTEQANKHFLDYTLLAYLTRIEAALNSCLLEPSERAAGMYFEFDVNNLLRGDSQQRGSYYMQMRQAGAITQNEIRTRENLPLVDGADDLHVPLNMAPSDQLAEILNRNKGGA
ncbi:phage portal protein [Comamonas terrigena]|uniref:phage portal protein n=1 Tax=Comamonas terrigena TaxID=32013 RepID=UPI0024486725|nr:phage portal protein [Comamonas terrigena]MDH0049639.1 phage portal protein [Comamonas terrigena]MDH0511291.1 phage portal protein [Comamonas terrigena]MDH1091406.1 phage portal protein [Comamonas terrigena]